MIKEAIGGFCMALADSVPGVSAGGQRSRCIRRYGGLYYGVL